jgi:drug/metabolite transporter (DMT)-like permease
VVGRLWSVANVKNEAQILSMVSLRKKPLGLLQLTTGAIMISFSPVYVKLAHVGPITAGFYRMLFGGIILLAILRIRGEKLSHGPRYVLMVVACSIFLALDTSFWHWSIRYVGPGLATLLANFQVFFLAAFGTVILREKLTLKLMVSIPLAMIGLYLILGFHWNDLRANYKAGILFGLIAAICYAAYILTLRKSQSETALESGLSTIALISLLTAFIMGLEIWIQQEGFGIPDLQSWGALLGYGVFSQALAWILIAKGLVRLEASVAGLILLLQPALAFVWDVLFFARPTVLLEVLGALLTLYAIYLGATSRVKNWQ